MDFYRAGIEIAKNKKSDLLKEFTIRLKEIKKMK